MKFDLITAFRKIENVEKYFFFIMVMIHLIPALSFSTFPTVDGPAHLYNSSLLNELSNESSILHEYFILNSAFLPNWFGHFTLSTLMLFVAPLTSEKILIVLYIILFPYSIRYFFNCLQLKEKYLLYFVFPFLYSFFLYYGFFNFLFGLTFAFIFLGLWLNFLRSQKIYSFLFVLLPISLLVYFSHLFVFGIMFGIAGLFYINKVALEKRISRNHLVLSIIIFTPGVVLTLIYLSSQNAFLGDTLNLELSELTSMLISSSPARGISYGREAVFTKWITILLLFIVISLIIERVRKKIKLESEFSLILGVVLSILLLFLFIIPDSTGSAGFISSRIVLLIFLFTIVLLGTYMTSRWIKVIPFIMICYVSIALLKIYYESTQEINGVATELVTCGHKIKENSTVASINLSQSFIYDHLSNYSGIHKPIILLENYEAYLNYFPLSWKKGSLPKYKINKELDAIQQPNSSGNDFEHVDYVLVYCDAQQNLSSYVSDELKTALHMDYSLYFKGQQDKVRLYRRK